MDRPTDAADQFRSASKIYQLVSEFVAPIVLGLLADYLFGTTPWGTILGTICGLVFGGVRVKLILQQLERFERDRAKRVQKDAEP